jgi:Acetyl xylan esterase (AXE1)/X-Pro dipeptidyl-peptidase C-terminal non-catalytic domain
MPTPRCLWALIAVVASLAVPSAAQAAIGTALGVSCTVQSDGVRFCGSSSPRSTSPAWDGTPIDVNIAFPAAPAQGPDGNYPLVMLFHGYGGGKLGLNDMQPWLDRGYATFSMTDRGFKESCGSAASRTAGGSACDKGYVRLIDDRYEVRDAQEFAGQLADAGLISSSQVAAVGGSYGGGMSMALGALKDRKMLPDGKLVRWRSPAGKRMRIAAAAPNIPWTDLAYSLVPNGSTLDYLADSPYRGRIGVEKQSYVNGLYLSGLLAPAFYAPQGSDPSADLTGWLAELEAGEPYGPGIQASLRELTTHHSSYYIDHSVPPAPLLISNGFTDDLFPADEAIRYYNRTRTEYRDADIALFFGDFGHPRGQNKSDVTSALRARVTAWFDYYVKHVGPRPPQGVEAYTQTCPSTAPSGGPYTASNWARIAPGEVRLADWTAKTIASTSTTGGAFNPIGSPACQSVPATDPAGAAVYKLAAAPAGGYTLLGAPTVIANFTLSGDTSQVAARLLDVAPDGSETLVARGLWRPATGGPIRQVFQLHPNGWTFAAGHVPKLELLAADADGAPLANYGRPSNNQQPVTVSKLELRLPVADRPGGVVREPAPKFVPPGTRLAADFAPRHGHGHHGHHRWR